MATRSWGPWIRFDFRNMPDDVVPGQTEVQQWRKNKPEPKSGDPTTIFAAVRSSRLTDSIRFEDEEGGLNPFYAIIRRWNSR